MVYLYSYLAFVAVLYPLLCWGIYVTSCDAKEYRYLMVGDVLVCLIISLIPVINLYFLALMMKEFGPWEVLNKFMRIKVFEGKP